MINMGIYPGHFQLKSALFLPVMDAIEIRDPPERLGRLPGMDVLVVADDADLIGIPGMRGDKMILIPPKMTVLK
jgi:hypothetical protein